MNMTGYVNAGAVAQHLGMKGGGAAVRRLMRLRGLPGKKVGGQWRFSLDEVDAWVERGQAKPSPRAKAAEIMGRKA